MVQLASVNIKPAAIPQEAIKRFVIWFILPKFSSRKPMSSSADKHSIFPDCREPIRTLGLAHWNYEWFGLRVPMTYRAERRIANSSIE